MMNPFHPILTNILLLYLGPETIMPIASILATIVGALLIGWRFFVGLFKKIFKRGTNPTEEETLENTAPEGVMMSQISEKDDQTE